MKPKYKDSKKLKFATKRPSRKSWVKTLDKLVREAIFARDRVCVRCGRIDQLAPSHIYPKGRYTRLRWDTDNILTLCFACHICWWHKNPIEAGNWFREKYPELSKKLKLRTQYIDKSAIDYNAIKLYLENEIQKAKNRTI